MGRGCRRQGGKGVDAQNEKSSRSIQGPLLHIMLSQLEAFRQSLNVQEGPSSVSLQANFTEEVKEKKLFAGPPGMTLVRGERNPKKKRPESISPLCFIVSLRGIEFSPLLCAKYYR